MPTEFLVFALTLSGVTVRPNASLGITLGGLALMTVLKLLVDQTAGLSGLAAHLAPRALTFASLFLILVGFRVLAQHFATSDFVKALPRWLGGGWFGALALLYMVFAASAVLGNIGAAVIGGVCAKQMFAGRVGVGYLAGIVAVANAGGCGSVLGDTTTTFLWLEGSSPRSLLPAYLGGVAAFAVIAPFAAAAQARFADIGTSSTTGAIEIDGMRLTVFLCALTTAVVLIFAFPLAQTGLSASLALLGTATWLALLLMLFARRVDWRVAPIAARDAGAIISLSAMATLLPGAALPHPSLNWTFFLGLLSGVFHNLTLASVAVAHAGYDSALVAYAVGYGGSLLWFGSSAGLALAFLFPQARSIRAWIVSGWFVPVGYMVGFALLAANRLAS